MNNWACSKEFVLLPIPRFGLESTGERQTVRFQRGNTRSFFFLSLCVYRDVMSCVYIFTLCIISLDFTLFFD